MIYFKIWSLSLQCLQYLLCLEDRYNQLDTRIRCYQLTAVSKGVNIIVIYIIYATNTKTKFFETVIGLDGIKQFLPPELFEVPEWEFFSTTLELLKEECVFSATVCI